MSDDDIIEDQDTDLARFYELAYIFGQSWLDIVVRLRQMYRFAQLARHIYYEHRHQEPHADNTIEATIEICSFFPFFEEKVRRLNGYVDKILEQLTLDDEDYQFVIEKGVPSAVLRTQYPLMLFQALQDDIYKTQINHVPNRLLHAFLQADTVDIERLLELEFDESYEENEPKEGWLNEE